MENRLKLLAILAFVFVGFTSKAQRQTPPVKIDSATEARIAARELKVARQTPGLSHLVIVGLTTFGFASNRTVTTDDAGNQSTSKSGGFGTADTYEFSPMFLWRQGNKVLLEFEPSFNNDGVGVNWAAISYNVAPNVILRGGYFVLPFGIYSKKLAAGWINKVATDPIGLPTAQDYGVGVSGGKQMGSMKWNYDLSITNGFVLQNDGQLQNTNLGTVGRGRTYTGRLGLLPLSDNSLELGVSGLTGDASNGNPQYQNARVDMYAFDLNYVKNISPWQINIKSQYNFVNVNHQDLKNPQDTTKTYSFTNSSSSGYQQLSLRPVNSGNSFLKNVELAFRYGYYNSPEKSLWGNKTTQTDYGINYWITWRTVLRMTYEILDTTTLTNPEIGVQGSHSKSYAFHMQFSIQL
ncbi:MAG: hypothetical protein JST14_04840 [Bacteroidetes bacterium]|nr:hypothetical protein [Bacteroidota bacterium]